MSRAHRQADRAGGLRPEPVAQSQPEALIPCAECERLREEIADYMGHRTDNVVGKLWAAQHQFGKFTHALWKMIGEPDRFDTGTDDYDQSLEIYCAHEDLRLGEAAQRLIHDAGFGQVYVNHGRKKGQADESLWMTHYGLHDELPVRGWRRRYVSEPTSEYDRVIAGEPDPGYWEISYWPEGWDSERSKAELARGYYRIVPDPLDPFASAGETRSDETPQEAQPEG